MDGVAHRGVETRGLPAHDALGQPRKGNQRRRRQTQVKYSIPNPHSS